MNITSTWYYQISNLITIDYIKFLRYKDAENPYYRPLEYIHNKKLC